MASRFSLPIPEVQNASGGTGSGWKLKFFEAGTSTLLDTYSDNGLTSLNDNPIVANAAGRFADIFLKDQEYKVLLLDASDVQQWSADPVHGGGSGTLVTATGSTTARSLAKRFAEVFSVKDYGAKGDGVTTDSTAINATITAASDGDTVIFPPGVYITGTLTPKTGVNLFGYGAILKLAANTDGHLIKGDGISRVTIEGIIFDGNSANQSAPAAGLGHTILFTDSSDSTQITRIVIRNCDVLNSLETAISFGAAIHSSITECYIQDATLHGIACLGGAVQNTEYCTFSYNRIKGTGGAGIIPMGTARYCSVIGNVIEDTGPAGDGITAYNNTVTEANVGHTISGNVITNANNHGIHVGGDHITVTGNTINEVALTSSGASGILIESETGDPDAQYISITGNTILCTNSNVGAGIDVQDRFGRVVISGNTIKNTATIGIRLQNDNNVCCVGNIVSESGTVGISVDGCIRWVISGNIVNDSNQDGISLLNGCDQSLISGNLVFNSGVSVGGGTGFALKIASDTDRVFIDGNNFRETNETSLVSLPSSPTELIFGKNYLSDGSTMEGMFGVISAATIALSPHVSFFHITGTTNITTVNGGWEGREVTLKFAAILTFTAGNNLKLAGNFVTTADDSITLVSDGTNWFEKSRSVNA